uniref:Uncharacterized protein n=1 Tax=Nothobranchius furzeri TaxID=105023 RepID=A0A8C6LK33_NOTFU
MSSSKNGSKTGHSVRRPGRPKKSVTAEKVVTQELVNSGSATSRRGRPKGSIKRGRGAPRKSIEQRPVRQELVTGGSQPGKRGRGRPKGSLNKVHSNVGQLQKDSGFLVKGRKRGRPRQKPGKRGRPRKYPLCRKVARDSNLQHNFELI